MIGSVGALSPSTFVLQCIEWLGADGHSMSSTSAYSDSTGQQITYDPLFTTMYKEGVIPPLFSLAILRDTSGPSGYLALGGTPPVNYVQEYTSTPILITSIQYYPKTYDFYTINIDGVTINGRSYADAGGSDIQYIVCLRFHRRFLCSSV